MAESQDGIAFSSARVDEVEYGGQHAFNVLQFNESAGVDKAPYFVQRQSDGNKLVTRDPFDPDPSRRYKIVGSERAPSALSTVCLLFDAALLLTDFQLNDDVIPTSNSGVAGFDAAGFAPFANMSWKVRCTIVDYSFLCASSNACRIRRTTTTARRRVGTECTGIHTMT